MIIGLAGVAGSGKDTFFNFCKDLNLNNSPSIRFAFADALKTELYSFLMEKFNISSFTENRDEKEMIRPMLVGYGMSKRKIDEDYWIKKVAPKLFKKKDSHNCFITDVRFHNEVDRIKELGGICIYIEKECSYAINDEEIYNDPFIRKKCTHKFYWPHIMPSTSFHNKGKKLVEKFFKNELYQYQ